MQRQRAACLVIAAVVLALATVGVAQPSLLDHTEAPHWTAESVQAALDAGADLEARSERGMTPLMTAAGWNESPDVVRVLVDAGADVKARPREAETVGRMRGHGQRLTSRAREPRTPLKEPRWRVTNGDTANALSGPATAKPLNSVSPSRTASLLVGATRFELVTPCSQSRCATRLRYAPPQRSIARRHGRGTTSR